MTNFDNLPTEIVFDILTRLPLKSLLCCRSVCRLWQRIVDSRSFGQQHLTTTENETPIAFFRRLKHHEGKIKFYLLVDIGFDEMRLKEGPILGTEFNSNSYRFFGACNGILCFSDYVPNRGLFLTNPIKKQVFRLPPAAESAYPHGLNHESYGLGYDRLSKEYKVVHHYATERSADRYCCFAAEVHTLGTNSWRRISSVPPFEIKTDSVVSAHGNVHWPVFFHGNGNNPNVESMIISFDFSKEEFVSTPHPDLDFKPYSFITYFRFSLLTWRGYLAIVFYASITHFDMWVLKDYDNNQWSREFIIDCGNWGLELFWHGPIGAWKDELVFEMRSKGLHLYNPITGRQRFLVRPLVRINHREPFCSFTSSLVSLEDALYYHRSSCI